MRKIYQFFFTTFALLMITCYASGQNNFFTNAGSNAARQTNGKREIFPQKFNGFSMDVAGMKSFLWSLPSEDIIVVNRNNAPVMQIPMPDGGTAAFRVWQSNVMEPGLAAKFPEMRQFLGQGIDDPYATIRFDYNPYTGFHGQILSAKNGRVYIDPYANGDLGYYMSYSANDYSRDVHYLCNVMGTEAPTGNNSTNRTEAACLGANLRTYRLALACTGEYAVAVAGASPTVPAVAAAMLTSVNRVTGVYEKEVSLRMVLITNNDLLIYLNGATDPYTNSSGVTMLGENQTNIDLVIGSGNYDIGHVFSTGGGGVATLRGPCTASKARGVTGRSNPIGDAFDIDYVAHEMGHQWGGNHTFNSVTSSCGGSNRNASTAYEVGSGTTIQAYAGICAADDIQPNSDPHFHGISFDEISNYITTGSGNSCGVSTPTGNTLPVIDPLPNNNLTIPINTPFTLTGSATDANAGDALTYCWEEWDLGPSGAWNSGAASTNAPLFKSRIPKTTGSRTFPDIAVIVANYPANPAATMNGLKGETLPTVARAMNFRLTVRDNRAGGGGVVSSGGGGCQNSTVFTVNTAGTTPFAVTSPNGGESYAGGSAQTITWDAAGTAAAPFNVTNVKISLSADGGLTYPTVILASTPNDGSETVNLPCASTTTARIKIEAIGNIFFDISNANFSIQQGFSFSSPAPAVSGCTVPASMSISLGTLNPCSIPNNINLTASGNPAGTTVSFSSNPVTPGSSTTVTLNGTNTLAAGTYIVTVTGTSAGSLTGTRDLSFVINSSAPPAITIQPAPQVVCIGSNATFSVTAPGASVYQWQVSTGGGPFSNISGANTASYTVSSATIGMSGNQYRVTVSTPCSSTVNSNSALLTVVGPASVTSQPVSVIVCEGGAATFTVGATTISGTLAYQWQFSIDGGVNWANISGANNSSYTQSAVLASQNGSRYRAVITSGCGTVNSGEAALTVNTYPVVAFGFIPVNFCKSDPSFSLSATPAGGTWSGTGVSGSTFTPTLAGVGTRTITYTVVNAGCTTAQPRVINVLECPERHRRLADLQSATVYPNPGNGIFNIELNSDLYTRLGARVFGADGKLYYSHVFTGLGYGSIIPVDIARLPGGVYRLLLYNNESGFDKRAVSIIIYK